MVILSEDRQGNANAVLVTTADLDAMARVWPYSGLRPVVSDGCCVAFQFDSHGNLCDINWFAEDGVDISEPKGIDQSCLAALSEDAQKFMEQTEQVRK